MLMPHTDLAEGLATAERIRAATVLIRVGPKPDGVTASFGVAKLATGEDGEAFILRIDKAPYDAKLSGRNCVVAG